MPEPFVVHGWHLGYYGRVTHEVRELAGEWVRRLEAGTLRRWGIRIRGRGGVAVDFPAEMGEPDVFLVACQRYPDQKVTVTLSDRASGSYAWFRHPDLMGCVRIVDAPARQLDLLPELIARDEAREELVA